MRLSETRPGTVFTVEKVLLGGEIGKRLADMGFTQGATGQYVRGAFLRVPFRFESGLRSLIRRCEAKLIEISTQ